jgi:hypothetical protein
MDMMAEEIPRHPAQIPPLHHPAIRTARAPAAAGYHRWR